MPVVEATPFTDDGKPSKPNLSEDGKGGSAPAGARYIYYRLYTKDGPLESNNPIYSNDRYISRISSRFVRPPHTAAMLKKYLCKIEGLGSFEKSALYLSLSEQTALDDSKRLSFRGTPGPGLSDRDAMAVVVEGSAVQKRSQAASPVDPTKLLERDYELRYVYYAIYDGDGGAVSKTSFDENTACLGRINTLSIPPPHTVASLKYHLIKSEEISGDNVQIFEDEDSEIPMNDNDAIAIGADTFPGFTEDRPIAIAYELQANISPIITEDPNEIQARELREARSELEESKRELAQLREILDKTTTQLQELSERQPSFNQKLRAIHDDSPKNSRWHTMKKGEIFHTDGVERKELYSGKNELLCYLAVSSSGKLAFVTKAWISFC